ncbi:ferredoxin [Rhizohabitans arisaemae]|uniref:ferredoxin n=1 Tax=Rhizohabitans arisaemae TaxID=2720610 RepID=UPI0024B193CF|nr:ferredoxin [Rhizohabitans arisaemae]
MKIVVDTGRCVGAGQCVLTAPSLFDQDDTDGVVVVRDRTPNGAAAEWAREAVRVCPSRALSLHE